MKEEYTSWEYFKEDTPITNIQVNSCYRPCVSIRPVVQDGVL